MAQWAHRDWRRVASLIDIFVACGCELHELPEAVPSPDGFYKIRFLLNPQTGTYVSLSDLADDDSIPGDEAAGWARILGIDIPQGQNH